MKICSIPGCGGKYYGRGFCSMHYQRWETHGDPNITLVPRILPRPDGLKVCSKCRTPKRSEDFSPGRYSWCKTCHRYYSRTKYSKDPEQRQRTKDGRLQREYGLTPEAWRALLEKQGGVCAICKQPEIGKNLDVDHCHKTGKIRGLLCGNCNRALGLLQESPSITQAATDYLKSQAS